MKAAFLDDLICLVEVQLFFVKSTQRKQKGQGWIEFIYQSLKLQAKAPIQMVGKEDEPASFWVYIGLFSGAQLAVIVENGI